MCICFPCIKIHTVVCVTLRDSNDIRDLIATASHVSETSKVALVPCQKYLGIAGAMFSRKPCFAFALLAAPIIITYEGNNMCSYPRVL